MNRKADSAERKSPMATALYAEVYLICLLIISILSVFFGKSRSNSTEDIWLRSSLLVFGANFVFNLLFTLFNGLKPLPLFLVPGSYLLKSLCHVTLCVAVYAWCGFVASQLPSNPMKKKLVRALILFSMVVLIAIVVINLHTHLLFEITSDGELVNHILARYEMVYLLLRHKLVYYQI